jgi:hypothetical protein
MNIDKLIAILSASADLVSKKPLLALGAFFMSGAGRLVYTALKACGYCQ